MNRKNFLKSLAVLPIAAATMKLNELSKMTDPLGGTERMSVGNGEIVEFAVAPHAGHSELRVSRPHQA